LTWKDKWDRTFKTHKSHGLKEQANGYCIESGPNREIASLRNALLPSNQQNADRPGANDFRRAPFALRKCEECARADRRRRLGDCGLRLTLRGVFVIIVLLLAGGAPAVAQRGPTDPQALAKEGAAALNERRFDDALAAFTAAAAGLPNDANVALGAGLAAYMLARPGDAETWLIRATFATSASRLSQSANARS